MESRLTTMLPRLTVLVSILAAVIPAQRRPGPGADPFRVVSAMEVHPVDPDGVPIVVRDADGQPIAGADVVVLQSGVLRTPEGRAVVNDPALNRFFVDLKVRMFAVATALGTRYVTDAEGRTRVVVDGSAQAFVAYRRAVQSGLLTERAKEREVEVVLDPPPSIEVLVRDVRGRPARGVPLMVVDAGERFAFQSFEAPMETGRDGRAWIPVPEDGEARELVVLIASRRARRLALDPAEPRIELALPACGQLRVYASGDGLEGGRRVTGGQISAAGSGGDGFGYQRIDAAEIGEDYVTFRWVGVGEPVRVTLEVDGTATGEPLETTGPSLADEMKVVRLEGIAAPIERTCRLLGLDGEPLSNTSVLWVVARPGDVDLRTTRTDLLGKLSFRIEPRDQRDDVVATLVCRGGEGEPRGAVRWTVPELRGTAEDLGDVALRPEPVLIAGRVVDAGGEPVAGVEVRCPSDYGIPGDHRSSSSSGVGERYYWQSSRTGADGRFELRELNPARPGVTLSVVTDPTIRVEGTLDYAVGVTDATIVLVPAARLEGAFAAFPDGVPFDGTVRLVAEGGAFQTLDFVQSRTRFDTDGLPAGRYAFEVCLWGRDEPVFRLDGIELEAGQTVRDPRLGAVDWSAFMKPVRLKVTDSRGQVLEGAVAMQYVRTAGGATGRGARRSEDGDFVLWVTDAGAEVRVMHAEYRSEGIEKLVEDRDLALEPRPRVLLHVKNLPDLPVWMTLRYRFDPAGDAGPGVGMGFSIGRSDSVTGAPLLVRPDLDGAARLAFDVNIDFEVQTRLRAAGARVAARFTRDVEVKVGDAEQELTVELTDDELASLQQIVTSVEEILKR